jgi:hypothetical protein
VAQDGNVGIGTATPQTLVHVLGSDTEPNPTLFMESNLWGQTGSGAAIRMGDEHHKISVEYAKGLKIESYNKLVLNTPTVGVNTENHQAVLHVNAVGSQAGWAMRIDMGDTDWSRGLEIRSGSDHTKSLIVRQGDLTNFEVRGSGMVYARGMWVKLGGFPDYVFSSDYELMGLNELEQYIEMNGHLPEVPTAREAETEGVELGEMNKLLLKKIEELTLYIIDQEKRIEQLEKGKQ